MKKIIIAFFSFAITVIFFDLVANFANLRPLLWKSHNYSYLNVGWYTWHGADHLYKNEVHSEQTNGFLTRGKKPDPKIENNIILLGDSTLETSHILNEMPENFLENYLKDTNVISFGSWGWSTDQQYLHLKENIKKIKPKHVILWFQMPHLIGNKHKHGFLGSKPTFNLKKKQKDNYYLAGPDRFPGKNYFEYSYFYRAFNKFSGMLKLRNSKSYYDYLERCDSGNQSNFVTKKELLINVLNLLNYEVGKKINTHYQKPYKNIKSSDKIKFISYEEWKQNNLDLFLIEDKKRSKLYSEEYLDDSLKYNRIVLSDSEIEKEILTNLLLLKIQELVKENQASFHVMFISLPDIFKPFKSEKIYRYCFNNRQFMYSNEAFDRKLDRIFKNINNILIINKTFNDLEHLDLFDGHFNKKGNKLVMEKLSNYIREFDN